MTHDQATAPTYAKPEPLAEGISRIIAQNPSPMTHWGTNTYLLGRDQIIVIDPGPSLPAHLDAIMTATAGKIVSHILVTHSHLDHSPLAAELSRRTGAKVYGFGPSASGRSAIMQEFAESGALGGGEGVDHGFEPDETLKDGETLRTPIGNIRAIHTPGHFGNHMCFVWQKTLFCGDHVMGWSTSLVSPPDGDLSDFLSSCEKLRREAAATFLPGHGAPIADPRQRLDWLIAHRQQRTDEILDVLRVHAADAMQITEIVYRDIPQAMWPIAMRNVLAHLLFLTAQGVVSPNGPLQSDMEFRLL